MEIVVPNLDYAEEWKCLPLEMVTDSQNKKHSYEEYLDGHLKSL